MGLQSGLHFQMSADRQIASGDKGAWQIFVVVPAVEPEPQGVVVKSNSRARPVSSSTTRR